MCAILVQGVLSLSINPCDIAMNPYSLHFHLSDGLRGAEGGEPGRVVGESDQQPLRDIICWTDVSRGSSSSFFGEDCDNWWTALRVSSHVKSGRRKDPLYIHKSPLCFKS